MEMRGTTICGVRRDGHIAIAGDGQVTMGEHTIFKCSAKKVRRIFNDSGSRASRVRWPTPFPCASGLRTS